MVVCIEPALGMFFRINTKPWQTPVLLEKRRHAFLKWDSFLECGEPLELDDYVVEEAVRSSGVIGNVLAAKAGDIWTAVQGARTISPADKQAIRQALFPANHSPSDP